MKKFMDLLTNEDECSLNVDDYVDRWHTGDSTIELHEYLGMTWEEFGDWVQGDRSLFEIAEDRRRENNGGGDNKDELYSAILVFMKDHRITCDEAIYQNDSVILDAHDLLARCFYLVKDDLNIEDQEEE